MSFDARTDLARSLDAEDPLGWCRELFEGHDDPSLPAYLDGNSLGRPLKATAEHLNEFVRAKWGGRLIRAWDEEWLRLPEAVGDQIGRVALGAATGQCVVADSTSVLLYKVIRAALNARPGRSEIVIERANFPTDRFIVEGIARDRGLTVRWVETPHDGGPTPETVGSQVGPATAVVVLSHVAYRSAHVADMETITKLTHDAGALIVWDLSHTVGSVPVHLDACGADFAVGCSYKYLNGGPGAPAWAYVAERHLQGLDQPIQGWLGSSAPFGMGTAYEPAVGVRRLVSGTPPILGMVAMQDMLNLLEQVGMDEVRRKSVQLTSFAIDAVDELMGRAGVVIASPRDADQRGSHITIDHPAFENMLPELWEEGVIPDFRNPHGLRLGLSPLSTSFEETLTGIREIARKLGVATLD
ncbi:aminotransferase class V-fold PLP-dependent enzyme [Arthrobacter sp. JZ12]|uniref:kynureninase n=1 Tax=Arthrobacter sp. JZ12 TaxID=2654190 RepID=UPI002B4717A6|nr:aminotransferase class V-fold PLP-dependent enzyme [Arthrobacter sp. JZ12]WRH24942.1 aminotransferase class V-fold PLP-dependent enzyme [Arthrobacter sp. JZ12]